MLVSTKTKNAGFKNADFLTDIVQRKTPAADTDIFQGNIKGDLE